MAQTNPKPENFYVIDLFFLKHIFFLPFEDVKYPISLSFKWITLHFFLSFLLYIQNIKYKKII